MKKDTRETILLAYISLCSEIGINQVTLQKVAQKAKLAFATVRYHFAEKGSSLEHEASMYVAQSGQRFTQSYIDEARKKGGFNCLKAYIDATFKWIESYPAAARYLIYFYYVSGTKRDLPIRNDSLVTTARLRTASLLHEAIGRGETKGRFDVEDMAVKVHSVIFGCGVLAMSISSKEEFARQRRSCWETVRNLLV